MAAEKDLSAKRAYARIAVRTDGDLVIGINKGLLQPGMVYELVMDDHFGLDNPTLSIRLVGESACTVADRAFEKKEETPLRYLGNGGVPPTWGHEASTLCETGDHLLTAEELLARAKIAFDKAQAPWPWEP